MKLSVIIPAHNEEKYISKCLSSINEQLMPDDMEVEIVVVLNRCTDKTKEIALSHGATVVSNDSKNVLSEIYKYAKSPDCLGGGIRIKPERTSLGIAVGYGMMLVPAFFLGLSFGMYWFRKSDFDAIKGFDEKRHIAEDVDFLKRLKRHGRNSGRKHKIISTASIITSCRKFDEFGDWHFVRIFSNPCRVRQAIVGNDRNYLDKNWYEVKR